MPTDRNMVKGEISVYADVLLKAATEEKTVFVVRDQLGEALYVIRDNMNLRDALSNEALPAKARGDIIRELFTDYDTALVATLAFMAERGDMKLLSRVKETYDEAAEKENHTVVVDVTTAIELTDELRQVIKNKMSTDMGGCSIELSEHIDHSIIGGIILEAHGKRIDASVRTQLENARTVMTTVPGGE